MAALDPPVSRSLRSVRKKVRKSVTLVNAIDCRAVGSIFRNLRKSILLELKKKRYFYNYIHSLSSIKKSGQGKLGKGNGKGKRKSEISGRIITDNEIDLGQVYYIQRVF